MTATTSISPSSREVHRGSRAGWLRAAVLGADDGIVSVSSLIIGVMASSGSRSAVLTAGVAVLVAGGMSMAAGEYVSVSSQRDAEQADIVTETGELAADPVGEQAELALIYERRGLAPSLAADVAAALTARDPLAAHRQDELGITDALIARPLQAACSSWLAFTLGAVLPVLTALLVPGTSRLPSVVALSLLALAGLGGLSAVAGGARPARAAARVAAGGGAAMAVTAAVGRVLGATGI